MKSNIINLLKMKSPSNYRISKDTGIAQATLSDYATGKSDVNNMRLGHAVKLNSYYKELDKVGRIWERGGYDVWEVGFDGDLKGFEIIKDGEVVAVITPDSVEAMEQIVEDLNNGGEVDGWEDGMGNVVVI